MRRTSHVCTISYWGTCWPPINHFPEHRLMVQCRRTKNRCEISWTVQKIREIQKIIKSLCVCIGFYHEQLLFLVFRMFSDSLGTIFISERKVRLILHPCLRPQFAVCRDLWVSGSTPGEPICNNRPRNLERRRFNRLTRTTKFVLLFSASDASFMS